MKIYQILKRRQIFSQDLGNPDLLLNKFHVLMQWLVINNKNPIIYLKGIIFILVGIWVMMENNSVVEYEVRYDD